MRKLLLILPTVAAVGFVGISSVGPAAAGAKSDSGPSAAICMTYPEMAGCRQKLKEAP